MNINRLLEPLECRCGRRHTCDIEAVYVEHGAILRLAELCPEESILLVADENTYSAAGVAAEAALVGRKISRVIFSGAEILIPDERAIEEICSKLADSSLIVGVGSGVIQDLCKYVSLKTGIPYYVVATAPSMDGYASVGAAMIWENMKVTFNCHVPEVIIGDVDVLKDAPMEMIRAGYGDILGKYSCLNDWKLSHIVNGEYFCQYVHVLMMDMVVKTQDLGAKLQNRESEAIQTLMEALAGAGVAMALVGNSRPASGSEHHMSHYYEITGIVHNTPYLMHGTDVVCSAVYTQQLREELLKLPEIPALREFNREKWEANIHRIYGAAADGVIALQNKLGWYQQNRYDTYAAKWNEIRRVLENAPTAERMKEYLNSVGLSLSAYTQLYGEEKIRDGIAYAKDLKDRYSVLWMYYELILQ